MSMYGTEASYEEQANARAWVTKDRGNTVDLTDLLAGKTASPSAESDSGSLAETAVPEQYMSAVHPVERLPEEYLNLPSGHEGSPSFLGAGLHRSRRIREVGPPTTFGLPPATARLD